MKRLLIVACILMQLQAFAEDKKNLKAEIKQVTVFLNKAQVTSSINTQLDPGSNELLIDGLPAGIDKQSIQVSGKGDFVIMAVKHELNFVDPQKKSKEMIALEDSIRFYQKEARKLRSLNDVYAKEEQMILANQSLKGEQHTITADQLEDVADFYRERLEEIKNEVIDIDEKLKVIQEKADRFQRQFNDLFNERNKNTSKVTISVSSKSGGYAQLELQYVVADAGWYPLYDIRVKDTKGTVQLNYKAQVYQNTGLDWNKVKVKLSSSNPALGGAKPELYPWYLDFYEPKPVVRTPRYKSEDETDKKKEVKSMSWDGYAAGSAAPAPAMSVSDYTTVVENATSMEFDIALPYTIPTGNTPQLVDIQSHEVKASYQYTAVPKIDQDAFLVGHITDWDELNLLSGNANIFFEGTFVGESFIDVNNTNDTLALSLGRDKKVVVKRNKIKDFTKKNFIGANKKEEYAFEIEVRNTKKESIDILVEDQIPVSQNSQIEVEAIDTGGAAYNKDNGKLQWKLSLGAGETKKVLFKYSVKYPKNKTVGGL
ncbi:MAG: DUF4139 domain-containing protein [Sporocytophaga sp.]|uniref:DUF4139 domain-containing protein n=1 Tax=Sporocytophaga sp. TaxID=2231183 RepID=UPI001B1AA509|nr:DUF4139 domain-containing protein [Sporocytophaga sp.]MBO9702267.1 DUF4139 domain-containing protein [Sporocytophaga sp.]